MKWVSNTKTTVIFYFIAGGKLLSAIVLTTNFRFIKIDFASSPWQRNDENGIAYILKWPLVFVLWLTVPDCRKRPKLRLVTFAACIIYIGLTSYMVSFLITVFGKQLDVQSRTSLLLFLSFHFVCLSCSSIRALAAFRLSPIYILNPLIMCVLTSSSRQVVQCLA